MRVGHLARVFLAIGFLAEAGQAGAKRGIILLPAFKPAPEDSVLCAELVIDPESVLVDIRCNSAGCKEVVGAGREIRRGDELILNVL